MPGSYVVTGAARGIGRAIADRLLRDGGHVVGVDLDAEALQWLVEPAQQNAQIVVGSASDDAVAELAASDPRWPYVGCWPPVTAVQSSTSPPTKHSARSAAHSRTRRRRQRSKD